MTELEMCCGTTCDKAKVKAEFEAIKQERDELAAQVERLREAADRLIFSIVFDDISLHPAAEKQFSDLQDVLAETPTSAIEALKAKLQAEAVLDLAERFKWGWTDQPGKYRWMLECAHEIRQRAQEAGE